MKIPNSTNPSSEDSDQIVSYLAEKVAHVSKKYMLPHEKVLKILSETAIVVSGREQTCPQANPWLEVDSQDASKGIIFHPWFENALKHLPSQKATELFLNEDRIDLARREYYAWVVKNAKLYSQDSLLSELNSLREHLLRNKPHLIRTGYAVYNWTDSYLFDRAYANLYPTKMLVDGRIVINKNNEPVVFKVWEPRDKKHSRKLQSLFRQKGIESFLQIYFCPDSNVPHWDGIEPPEIVPHESANLLPGMKRQYAEVLELARPRILEINVKTLEQLMSTINGDDDTSPFHTCLNLLVSSFSAHEIDFFEKMDRLYCGIKQTGINKYTFTGKFLCRPGGILDIFSLIHRVDEAVSLRSNQSLLSDFGQVFAWCIADRRPFFPYDSYYEAIACHAKEDVDSMLDTFYSNEEKERLFAFNYAKRINDSMREEFYENIFVDTRVKRKHSEKLKNIIKNYADLLSNQINKMDSCTTPDEVLSNIIPSFSHSPDYRSVSLRGQPFRLTPYEAQVIEILHKGVENGTPDLGLAYLIQEVCGSEANYSRLKDIFRNDVARKTLIKKSGKGLYRLNI